MVKIKAIETTNVVFYRVPFNSGSKNRPTLRNLDFSTLSQSFDILLNSGKFHILDMILQSGNSCFASANHAGDLILRKAGESAEIAKPRNFGMSETGTLWAAERTKTVSSAIFFMPGVFLAYARLRLACELDFGMQICARYGIQFYRHDLTDRQTLE